MAELPLHALQAGVLTLRSLVDEILRQTPRERRGKLETALVNELLLTVWRGIPGQSRVPGQPPSAADLALVPVLEVVHRFWPRPLRPLA